MIIDQLCNVNQEVYNGLTTGAGSSGLRSPIQAALHYLQTADLTNAAVGKVEIDGSRVFALIQAARQRLLGSAPPIDPLAILPSSRYPHNLQREQDKVALLAYINFVDQHRLEMK